jgi:hypothetical protein
MADLAFGRFGAVLDLGYKLRFDLDASMRDAFAAGLGLWDQRPQSFAQVGGGFLVEAQSRPILVSRSNNSPAIVHPPTQRGNSKLRVRRNCSIL